MITLLWRRGLLRLRIDRSRVWAEAVELGAVSWAGKATYGDHADLADTIARLASEAPPHRRWLTVQLDRPPVQVRTLTDLPPVKPAALFIARRGWERRAVDKELVRLRQPLSVVLAARHELRDAEATVNAVTAADRLRGRSMAALVAITRALPDSAVLTILAWSADG